MTMTQHYIRRSILQYLLAGGLLIAASCSGQTTLTGEESGQRTLRLVFYSDVHARAEWDTPEALMMAANAINAQSPDLVIGGGDLITDGFQSSADAVAHRWDVYMAMHNALEGEVHSVIGNHDLVAAIPEDGTSPSADPRAIFRERLGVEQTYYSFDLQGYHVILLDSIQITDAETKYQGMIGTRQLNWLKEDLSKVPGDQPIIVAMHFPLLTTFYQATEGATAAAPPGRVVVNNREVLDAFKNHNLILVLQGHLHVSQYVQWQKTAFISGGSISGKWWRGSWHGTKEGFTLVTLRDDDVEWEYRTYGWQARRPQNR